MVEVEPSEVESEVYQRLNLIGCMSHFLILISDHTFSAVAKILYHVAPDPCVAGTILNRSYCAMSLQGTNYTFNTSRTTLSPWTSQRGEFPLLC